MTQPHSKDEVLRMAAKEERAAMSCLDGSVGRSEHMLAADMLRAYAEVVDGWRPIESAPKDGTTILVGTWLFMEKVKWDVRKNYWTDGLMRLLTEPTHWRPLPAYPPNTTAALSTKGG